MNLAMLSPAPDDLPKKRKDVRAPAVVLFVISVLALGYIVQQVGEMPEPGRKPEAASPLADGFHGLRAFSDDSKVDEKEALLPGGANTHPPTAADTLLGESAKLLGRERYDDALRLLQKNHALLKDQPSAYLQIGNALLGKADYSAAGDFFLAAIDRDPQLADAYFGFAQAAEGMGDLESALGAMRSFIHVSGDKDPFRLKIAQARSAIWEWESKLGRGPWGPTGGIPPGFTEAELLRDKKHGVGTKMPIPGARDENGVSQYEIKLGDRIPMYKK